MTDMKLVVDSQEVRWDSERGREFLIMGCTMRYFDPEAVMRHVDDENKRLREAHIELILPYVSAEVEEYGVDEVTLSDLSDALFELENSYGYVTRKDGAFSLSKRGRKFAKKYPDFAP